MMKVYVYLFTDLLLKKKLFTYLLHYKEKMNYFVKYFCHIIVTIPLENIILTVEYYYITD